MRRVICGDCEMVGAPYSQAGHGGRRRIAHVDRRRVIAGRRLRNRPCSRLRSDRRTDPKPASPCPRMPGRPANSRTDEENAGSGDPGGQPHRPSQERGPYCLSQCQFPTPQHPEALRPFLATGLPCPLGDLGHRLCVPRFHVVCLCSNRGQSVKVPFARPLRRSSDAAGGCKLRAS